MTLINPAAATGYAPPSAKPEKAAASAFDIPAATPQNQGVQTAYAPTTASTNFYAQLAGYEPEPTQNSSAVDAFLAIMSKTPEELLFTLLLAQEGLTQEEFDALPPEEKLAIEEKIRAKIEEMTKQEVAEHVNNAVAEKAATEATSSYDFKNMTPAELLNTVNDLIKSGQMTVDESSSLVMFMAPEGAMLSIQPPQDKINVFEKLEQSLAFNEYAHNYNGATYDRKAIEALMRFQV